MRALFIGLVLLVGFGGLALGPAAAQGVGSRAGMGAGGFNDVEASGAAYYVFTRPGEATIQVLVMNSVGASGIFQVGASTSLEELLLLSGASVVPNQRGESREAVVRLYRRAGGSRSLLYEAPMVQAVREPGEVPGLEDGDVFVVEEIVRQRFGWRDGLQVVTGLASLLLVADRLSRWF